MFLEKLSIQGFKSFADKNELPFVGLINKNKRGITAIVGPNGSGKSNISDAVRWALGEQSMKTLRGKKTEDIIFSGSTKKSKLSMAQVSLYLNNEDKQADIDFTQIIITRRLYRNGDSEYLLNNNKVRLFDIQMLLAKANFGQKTYSVIGQGMVESFLNTSLAERKEFFDEATGVKQYQIKRDDSLNKLKAGYINLEQTTLLLNEIEPRLKSLTRQVKKLHKRDELEKNLQKKQLKYFTNIWHKNNNEYLKFSNEYLKIEKEKNLKQEKLNKLNTDLEKLKSDSNNNDKYNSLQQDLTKYQNEKDYLNKNLTKLESQIEIKLEAKGKFDLSFLINKKEELSNNINITKKEIIEIDFKLQKLLQIKKNINLDIKTTEDKLNNLNKDSLNLTKKIQENIQKINHTENDNKNNIENNLRNLLTELEKIEKENNFENWKTKIIKIKNKLNKILTTFYSKEKTDKKPNVQIKDDNQDKWENLQKEIAKIRKEKENLLSKNNENKISFNSFKNQINFLENKINQTKNEIIAIKSKIKQQSTDFDFGILEDEKNKLKIKLKNIDDILTTKKEELNNLKIKEDQKRNNLFILQKNWQETQNELNFWNNKINKIKIEQTRYETKLEDLEIEIREEFGDLNLIKNSKIDENINSSIIKNKIIHLKKHLEQIGGIDPAVEDEYTETKERYDFLSNQSKDFTETAQKLEKIIKKLDLIIKEKFDKEFKIISKKFEEYFKILFNGGTAKIVKILDNELQKEKNNNQENKPDINEEEKNIFDLKKIKFLQKHNATNLAGIEIKACPPDKKINSISMLSGGERALTAIAMISAIISANPSPFVILDEVDAALDEANSERLAKILDDLSQKTQFITVTHNRALMRKANILYGVTMGDDGVSKLLSIKLDKLDKIKN